MMETQVFMVVRSGATQRCDAAVRQGVGRWCEASCLTRRAGGTEQWPEVGDGVKG